MQQIDNCRHTECREWEAGFEKGSVRAKPSIQNQRFLQVKGRQTSVIIKQDTWKEVEQLLERKCSWSSVLNRYDSTIALVRKEMACVGILKWGGQSTFQGMTFHTASLADLRLCSMGNIFKPAPHKIRVLFCSNLLVLCQFIWFYNFHSVINVLRFFFV